MRQVPAQLEKLLRATFDSAASDPDNPAEQEKRRADFVFHMTDWIRDLEELHRLYQEPRNTEEARRFLIGCVAHVTGHLNAACRLLLDEAADPFAPEKQVVHTGKRP